MENTVEVEITYKHPHKTPDGVVHPAGYREKVDEDEAIRLDELGLLEGGSEVRKLKKPPAIIAPAANDVVAVMASKIDQLEARLAGLEPAKPAAKAKTAARTK